MSRSNFIYPAGSKITFKRHKLYSIIQNSAFMNLKHRINLEINMKMMVTTLSRNVHFEKKIGRFSMISSINNPRWN